MKGIIASFSHTDSSIGMGGNCLYNNAPFDHTNSPNPEAAAASMSQVMLLSFVMLSLSFACLSIEGLHLCLRFVSRNKPMARESQFEWNRFRRGFRRNPSLTLAE